MGLRESRIINSVHPWLGARLRWLADVANVVGSSQQLISGNRTRAQQQELFERVIDRPVARPGCSQHQYGFAADAQYFRATGITSKGRGVLASQTETDHFMASAAHHVSLTTVANDPGHLQIYPGAQFKSWAVSRGFCNPNPRFGFALESLIQTNLRQAAAFISQAEASANFLDPFFIGR